MYIIFNLYLSSNFRKYIIIALNLKKITSIYNCIITGYKVKKYSHLFIIQMQSANI